jgi:hypothetical protein
MYIWTYLEVLAESDAAGMAREAANCIWAMDVWMDSLRNTM